MIYVCILILIVLCHHYPYNMVNLGTYPIITGGIVVYIMTIHDLNLRSYSILSKVGTLDSDQSFQLTYHHKYEYHFISLPLPYLLSFETHNIIFKSIVSTDSDYFCCLVTIAESLIIFIPRASGTD